MLLRRSRPAQRRPAGRGLSVVRRRRQGALGTFPPSRIGWPPSGSGVRLSRAGPFVARQPFCGLHHRIAEHGLAIAAGGAYIWLTARTARYSHRRASAPDSVRNRTSDCTGASPLGSSIGRYRPSVRLPGSDSVNGRPPSSAGVNQAGRGGRPAGVLGHHRLGRRRRPAPDRPPVRRASPSGAPPGRARPDCAGCRRPAGRSTRPCWPVSSTSSRSSAVGRLLAVVGAAAGQVPPAGARVARRAIRVSSTRPAGSVTTPYAPNRCRRSGSRRRAPARRAGPPSAGERRRPAGRAGRRVNGISGSPAASAGAYQRPGRWCRRPRRRAACRRARCTVEQHDPVGVHRAVALGRRSRRRRRPPRSRSTATVSPVSSANSRTTASPGARRARRRRRAAARPRTGGSRLEPADPPGVPQHPYAAIRRRPARHSPQPPDAADPPVDLVIAASACRQIVVTAAEAGGGGQVRRSVGRLDCLGGDLGQAVGRQGAQLLAGEPAGLAGGAAHVVRPSARSGCVDHRPGRRRARRASRSGSPPGRARRRRGGWPRPAARPAGRPGRSPRPAPGSAPRPGCSP